jgi:hypothetical protein
MKRYLATFALILILALTLLPGGSVAAQKSAPPPTAIVLDPNPLPFNGLGATQTVEVQVEEVFNFYAAQFTLTFNPTIINVVNVTSGPAFGHSDLPGAPVVTIGPGSVTFANTRFSDPISYADRLTLATITFVSVVPGPTGLLAFGGNAQIIQPSGVPFPAMALVGGYGVIPAIGVLGQALWPRPVANHNLIPVHMTNAGGSAFAATTTNAAGFYPVPPLFPPMPASGQLHINPLVFQRIPALETRLRDCPATPNLTAHTVRLVGGDVAPLLPGRAGNNVIDIADLVLSASRFGLAPPDTNGDSWPDGDVDRNGTVNIQDIVIIANNFGQRGPIYEPCP